MTISKFAAVFHAERTFGEFGRHAKETGKDHPEGGTGTADGDGHRHTGDVAKAHRARECCCQRLEVADLAGVVRVRIFATNQINGVPKGADLDEAEIESKYQCRKKQPADDERKGRAADRNRIENEVRNGIGYW